MHRSGVAERTMGTPATVDGRNIFNPEKARDAGFIYRGVVEG